MKLHEERRFKTAGRVNGLTMMGGDVLVVCGSDRTNWAVVYDRAGRQQAKLQLPRGCQPRGVVQLGSHLLMTDEYNKCLQVGQPLQHD